MADRPGATVEFLYAPAAWLATDGRPRFVGTAKQVVDDFRLLGAAGVDQVTVRLPGRVEHAARFADEVMAAFSA